MFERFDANARRVLVFAQEEARLLNHDYIGTEHLLLGLIHDDHGAVTAHALGRSGVSLEKAREQVQAIVGMGQQKQSAHIPFTPRARKVLELALREALDMKQKYVGTEHILLGLVRGAEQDGSGSVAAQVLTRLDVSLNEARAAALVKSSVVLETPRAHKDVPLNMVDLSKLNPKTAEGKLALARLLEARARQLRQECKELLPGKVETT